MKHEHIFTKSLFPTVALDILEDIELGFEIQSLEMEENYDDYEEDCEDEDYEETQTETFYHIAMKAYGRERNRFISSLEKEGVVDANVLHIYPKDYIECESLLIITEFTPLSRETIAKIIVQDAIDYFETYWNMWEESRNGLNQRRFIYYETLEDLEKYIHSAYSDEYAEKLIRGIK